MPEPEKYQFRLAFTVENKKNASFSVKGSIHKDGICRHNREKR
jgi:hypothetical protein